MTISPLNPRANEPLAARMPAGAVLGAYVVDGWLRDGGMASLYRGHHQRTRARVAIKVQVRGGEDDRITAARFDREGIVMGRLSGEPNVVQVHDVDALSDGRRYLVTEWVDGDNLEELLDRLRNADSMLAIGRACRILADVATALEASHRADIVHRDVKPANIMVDQGTDRERARLLDFGISADLGVAGQIEGLTATGVVLGSSAYVAPEQAVGLPANPCFDIYSLGIVAFELVTGFSIPPGGLGPELLPPISRLRTGVPGELETLVGACLSRDLRRRPTSAAEVAERLRAIAATVEPHESGTFAPGQSCDAHAGESGAGAIAGLGGAASSTNTSTPNTTATSSDAFVPLAPEPPATLAAPQAKATDTPAEVFAPQAEAAPPTERLVPQAKATALPAERLVPQAEVVDTPVGPVDLRDEASTPQAELVALSAGSLAGPAESRTLPAFASASWPSPASSAPRLAPIPTRTDHPAARRWPWLLVFMGLLGVATAYRVLRPDIIAELPETRIASHIPRPSFVSTAAAAVDVSSIDDASTTARLGRSVDEATTSVSDGSNSSSGYGTGAPESVVSATSGNATDVAAPRRSPSSPDTTAGGLRMRCQQDRNAADLARTQRTWRSALRLTSDAECWSSEDERVDRTVLRVQALLELGRYRRCIAEGKGLTDPRVARITKFCRDRAAYPGG